NLRQLQDKSALDEIFLALNESQNSNLGTQKSRKPILVKIAPDLSFDALDEILELVSSRRISGIVASNTTIARPQTSKRCLEKIYSETGGLSGRPLRQRSIEMIRHIFKQTRGALPIIGVGGVFDAADAFAKIRAGASLVQIYTGLVYEGPSIARNIVTKLKRRLAEEGFAGLKDAVGVGAAPHRTAGL
ncbi:MAG: dihydroorotate dehydrogenase (quinone), partial [Verrucomicrobiota bacterium]